MFLAGRGTGSTETGSMTRRYLGLLCGTSAKDMEKGISQVMRVETLHCCIPKAYLLSKSNVLLGLSKACARRRMGVSVAFSNVGHFCEPVARLDNMPDGWNARSIRQSPTLLPNCLMY